MEKLTEPTKIEFKPEILMDLNDLAKSKEIYENSIILPNNTNYRKIVLNITFEDINNNNLDIFSVYCFNPKTNIENETLGYFSFSKYKPIPSQLNIDIEANITEIDLKEPFLIDRIGFHIGNSKMKTIFTCQVFEKSF